MWQYDYTKIMEEEKNFLSLQILKLSGEPVVCRRFGCGKVLTREEWLHGDHCVANYDCNRIDIMSVLKLE